MKRIHFFLNHGMSLTLRGIRSVPPLRPSEDFADSTVWLSEDLPVTLSATFFAADDVFSAADFAADEDFLAVVFAADFAFVVAFFAADFDFVAADLAADADFLAPDLAADFAFVVAFFAAPEALSAAIAAALILLATAALSPASWSFLEPAEATFETVSIFADTNFFAVAAPIPGNAVNVSIFESPFPVMGSPTPPCGARFINTSPATLATMRWIDGA